MSKLTKTDRRTGLLAPLRWVFWVSRRFNRVDFRGRTAVTSRLASLGIAFGVMALIAVMSVMNGFQMEYIEAILEVSSYHIQVRGLQDDADEARFASWCSEQALVQCVLPFAETRGLLVESEWGDEQAAVIRALPADALDRDGGFRREMELVSGYFDLEADNAIVLGSTLARSLGAEVGSLITILASGGSADAPLFSPDRVFRVTGVFRTNYADINSAYCFISLDAAERLLGMGRNSRVLAVKLRDSNKDGRVAAQIKAAFPACQTEGWRDYNRAFFGALRVEKNVLMLMVILIFIVVAVNIYNAMCRMIYERRQDIAVLSALGGRRSHVEAVFSAKGLITGLTGALPGLVLGILLAKHMDRVFIALSKLQYYAQYAAAALFRPEDLPYVRENIMFSVFASVPARMQAGEVCAIFLFGVLSSLASSLLAGRKITRLNVSELLRDE